MTNYENCNTTKKTLNLCGLNNISDDIIQSLAEKNIQVLDAKRRSPKAISFVVNINCADVINNYDNAILLNDSLRNFFYEQQIDFALQNEIVKPKKLLISDMDATIVVGETIDEMAASLNLQDKISQITQKAMRGELDFAAALRERLGLLAGLDKSVITELVKQTKFSTGADIFLDYVNSNNIYSCLVSGGFTLFTEHVSNCLGFKQHVANELGFDENNKLTGAWVGELVDANTKLKTINLLCTELAINLDEAIAIGDGANDIPMLKAAGLGVAFVGKPAARKAVSAEIHTGHLENLIYLI